ncbi:Flp pilus assembly protein TadB [Paenibacillaceae bacterium GAS479]|nr:Flp pilus assembly protein TadB [Paenibacillaceae bacterium GAS479]
MLISPWMIPVIAILLAVALSPLIAGLLRYGEDSIQASSRLEYRRSRTFRARLILRLERSGKPYQELNETLESLQTGIKPEGFVLLSAFLLVMGTGAGVVLFESLKGAVLLGLMLSLIPYLVLKMVLVHRQMQTRLDFLPAVELFYQCYLIAGQRQVRGALKRMVEENRLQGHLKASFEQLYRNLSVRGDDEVSLRLFAASLGHVWGEYFVQIIRVALHEGHSVADNLHELIGDMRRSRRANEQERHKLLEIRVANFTPIFFLALFLGINFRYNPDNSYRYYVNDAAGRDMLLNSLLLIFASFLMGLWLSRKKM